MKRLQIDQTVTLAVGDETLECRVTGFTAGEVTLVPAEDADAGALPQASGGASLVFEHRGGLVQLVGALHQAGDTLHFAGSRRAAAPEQRRRAARLELALPVTLTPLGGDAPRSHVDKRLVTIDLSLGGMGVRLGGALYARGTLVGFALVPPGGEPLVGTARVVHVTGEMCGLQFEEVNPTDRVRLAGYLVGLQRGRAKRGAATARG